MGRMTTMTLWLRHCAGVTVIERGAVGWAKAQSAVSTIPAMRRKMRGHASLCPPYDARVFGALSPHRRCERSEAIQHPSAAGFWIASSQERLAMTERGHRSRSPNTTVIPRESRESSTLRLLGSITTASGMLDRPVKPGDDGEWPDADTPSHPRGSIHPSFASSPHPHIQEGAGKAGCRRHPRSAARSVAQGDRTATNR